MSETAIILIILLGILLFFIEFFIIPGVTIAGIGGFLLILGAIIAAFHYHGPEVGLWTLGGTLLFFIFGIIFMVRSRTWKRVMLATNVDGTVENIQTTGKIKPGDSGKTITRLNPIGKVLIDDTVVEAKSIVGYMKENTDIEVVKVQSTNIIVKPKNN
jgi:membrane-bound ClpP family serine protease